MVNTISLKETFNEIAKLQNKLQLLLDKKKINFQKTQPKSIKLKDIIVNKSSIIFDSFTTYMIKDEEVDEEIYIIQQSLLAYQEYLAKEIQRMKQFDDVPLIVYLKEEANWSWKQIDKELHYSEDYSRLKYNRYKKNKIDTV